MINIPAIEWTRVMNKNQYPDNTAKRLHLKGIDAAQSYLNKPSLFERLAKKLLTTI